jgi:hypothetical protein
MANWEKKAERARIEDAHLILCKSQDVNRLLELVDGDLTPWVLAPAVLELVQAVEDVLFVLRTWLEFKVLEPLWVWQIELLGVLGKHPCPRKHDVENVEILLPAALLAHTGLFQKVLRLHRSLDGAFL